MVSRQLGIKFCNITIEYIGRKDKLFKSTGITRRGMEALYSCPPKNRFEIRIIVFHLDERGAGDIKI